MKRHTVVCFCATTALALSLLSGTAVAQQKSIKDQNPTTSTGTTAEATWKRVK